MTETQKLNFTMVGSRTGVPTLEDMIALATHLGHEPTPESIARCKMKLDAALAQLPRK